MRYLILFFVIFAAYIGIGAFVAGNVNIMDWGPLARFTIILFAISTTGFVFIHKEL